LAHIEPDELVKTKQFLEDVTASVHSIVHKKFPEIDGGDREDIEQEVKLKIWRIVSHGKKIDNIKSYLWKVVYTTALDIMETKLKNLSLEDYFEMAESGHSTAGDVGGHESGINKDDLKMVLEKIVDALPPKRRTILKLHLAGMDIDEMADFLNWTHHKVRHLFYRGLQDLKAKLKAGEDPSRSLLKEGSHEKLVKNAMP
jgi:RNA polymerase sigma-70 factor (ECF subfamily)